MKTFNKLPDFVPPTNKDISDQSFLPSFCFVAICVSAIPLNMPSHISPTIPWQGHKQEGKRWKQIGLLMEVCFIRKKRLPRSPLAIGQNWITSSPLDQSKGNKLSYLDFGQSWLKLFIWAIVTQTQLGFNSEEKRNWGGNNSQIFFPVLTVLLTPSYIFPTARWAALPHCPTVASNSAIQETDYCSYPLTLSPLFAFPDFSSGNFIHTLWRLWTLGLLLMPSLMPSLSSWYPREVSSFCLPIIFQSSSLFPLFLPHLQSRCSRGTWTTSYHLKWAAASGSWTLQLDVPS